MKALIISLFLILGFNSLVAQTNKVVINNPNTGDGCIKIEYDSTLNAQTNRYSYHVTKTFKNGTSRTFTISQCKWNCIQQSNNRVKQKPACKKPN